jgi:hypothetical protein
MSSPWRITRGDQQFTVKDVAELKLMGVGGKVRPSDLIQRPGGTDWLYATEVPELQGLLKVKAKVDDDDEWGPRRRLPQKLLKLASGLLFAGILVVGFAGLWFMYKGAPAADQYKLFGDHEGAMSPLAALATESANLLKEPDSRSAKVGVVDKDDRVDLIRKLGDFYEVETAKKEIGWVGSGQVIPGYMFDQTLADQYDPLFNPDIYLILANYAWTPVGEEDTPETLTEMQFQLDNPTEYGMTGVMLHITFYDGSDRVMGRKDFEVPRLLPPHDSLHVEGIQVDLAWDEETRAEVDIVGARALLPGEYSRLKADEDARIAAEALENPEEDSE